MKTPSPRYVKVGKSDEVSINNFISHLQSQNIFEKMNKDLSANPNINYSILEKIVLDSKRIHLPVKTVKFNKYKHKRADWITSGIVKSIHFRDKLYLRLKKKQR